MTRITVNYKGSGRNSGVFTLHHLFSTKFRCGLWLTEGGEERFRHVKVKPAAYNQVHAPLPCQTGGGARWIQGLMGTFGSLPFNPDVSSISGSSGEPGGASTWSDSFFSSSCWAWIFRISSLISSRFVFILCWGNHSNRFIGRWKLGIGFCTERTKDKCHLQSSLNFQLLTRTAPMSNSIKLSPQRSSPHTAGCKRHSRWSCPAEGRVGWNPSWRPSQSSFECLYAPPTPPPGT